MPTSSAAETHFAPPVRWSWLWSPRRDLLLNLVPFWAGFALLAALYVTRNSGASADDPGWTFSWSGRQWDIMVMAGVLYGPIVDGPHLWATIARTYTDPEEWAHRRSLFISSLWAFAIGPIMVLLPYAIHAITPIPEHMLGLGFKAWFIGLSNYAIFHIAKQHWGFVSLYKRKNGDADAADNRADAWFFHTAIWLPYFAMYAAPWDPETAASPIYRSLFTACHALFLTACIGYTGFQVLQWKKGVARNGPKLLYLATVIGLYYLTFACHPRLAAFWVLITGTGHCAQYHGVVWAYGKKKYGGKPASERILPNVIFDSIWLYLALGVIFTIVTLQGPFAGTVKNLAAGLMQTSLFSRVFTFLDANQGMDLGLKVCASIVGGVRIHHFYVDSKIWKVGKSPELAKNLDVAPT